MTLYASADLLSDFKFLANRTGTDAALTDAQIYRELTKAQQNVAQDIAALFPRMLMGAPALMTTSDGGITYKINGTDEDTNTVYPFGHAEVYAASTGRDLFGSNYSTNDGDVVFEGNKIRIPSGGTRTFTDGPYIRYVAMPGTLNGSNAPTLRPPQALQLVVYRALVQWANRGGMRDPQPYEEMYQRMWQGNPQGIGQVGLLGLLSTQYARSHDGALAGQRWWRWYLASGGVIQENAVA